MTQTEIIQVLSGFVGSVGFGLLFNIRGKRLCFAAAGGFVSWLLFVILGYFIDNEVINYFIVALAVSIYAEIMARVLKTPTTALITTSLIPLIPGGSLYYTMAYAFGSDSARFVDKGVHTLQLASALALGIIVATTFFNLLNHGRKTK